MDKVQRKWVLYYALSVMAITTIPYLLGFLLESSNQNKDKWVFTGFIVGVEDGNSYIAKMLNGSSGEWLFQTPYTSMPQTGVIAFIPYILIGKLAAGDELHLQLVLLFHIFRFGAGLFLILAVADFISLVIKDQRLFTWCVVIATIGGGLGWLLILIGREKLSGSIPLEFYSPETFGFLHLFGLPHLALSRAFLFLGLSIYLRVFKGELSNNISNPIKVGALWLGIAVAQPITAIIFGILLIFHVFLYSIHSAFITHGNINQVYIDWRKRIRFIIISGIIPLPLIVYTFVKFSQEPFLISWTAQNKILSPPFVHYLSAYGLLLLFGFYGLRSYLKREIIIASFLIMWVILFPIFAYAPIGVQRRLTEGVWVAIVCLGFIGFQEVDMQLAGFVKKITLPILGLVSLGSTCLFMIGSLITVQKISIPVYQPYSKVQAFKYLEKISIPDNIVLASYQTGNALPAWSNVKVIIGHGPESIDLPILKNQITDFFGGKQDDNSRQNFLMDHNVHFIFYGPDERMIGNWNPDQATYLELVYQSDGYKIFKTEFPEDINLAE